MSANKLPLFTTGASGQLERLVLEHHSRLDPSAGELAPFRVSTHIGKSSDIATTLAQTSAASEKGALEDHGVLSRLIGHQTRPLADAVAAVEQSD